MSEAEAFKELALWAKKHGASGLKVEHMEITFFMDPRILIPPDEPDHALTDADREDAMRAAEEARKRKMFRSA